MTEEWLRWFLAQKPFYRTRLIMKNNDEHVLEAPSDVASIGNGNALIGKDLGMGRKTISLSDIVDVRQDVRQEIRPNIR